MTVLNSLCDHLRKITNGLEFDHPRWIGGPESDAGPSYCLKCAMTIVEQYNKSHPSSEKQFVDGGWGSDNDGVCTCEKCGSLLEYTLTDEGVESELEHFDSLVDSEFANLSPNVAYELLELFESGLHIESASEGINVLANRIALVVPLGSTT